MQTKCIGLLRTTLYDIEDYCSTLALLYLFGTWYFRPYELLDFKHLLYIWNIQTSLTPNPLRFRLAQSPFSSFGGERSRRPFAHSLLFYCNWLLTWTDHWPTQLRFRLAQSPFSFIRWLSVSRSHCPLNHVKLITVHFSLPFMSSRPLPPTSIRLRSSSVIVIRWLSRSEALPTVPCKNCHCQTYWKTVHWLLTVHCPTPNFFTFYLPPFAPNRSLLWVNKKSDQLKFIALLQLMTFLATVYHST